MRGAATRDQHLIRAAQAVAYSVAVLTGCAVNNAKKMPSFAKAFPDTRGGHHKRQSQQQDVRNFEQWLAIADARNPGKALQ